MDKQEKQFKKEYLEEKLHLIGDRLNDAYGPVSYTHLTMPTILLV